MASFLDKFKITTGIDTNTTLDLSCTHVTTSDWMHSAPVYSKEMVPGESLKIQMETFTRLAPLAVPTFGRGLIHNRAFFVPFRTIFKKWDEFITAAEVPTTVIGNGTPSSTSCTVSKVPTVKNLDLVRAFVIATAGAGIGNNVFATLVTPGGGYDESKHDILFREVNSGGTETVYAFDLTTVGRRFMKILQSLGYQMNWIINSQTPVDAEYSALPLIAWLKVICDWYYPSQYVGDAIYNTAMSLINAEPDASGSYSIGFADLRTLFGSSLSPFSGLVNYDSDYFVSAFDNPNGSSVGGFATGSLGLADINFQAGTAAVQTFNNQSITNGDIGIYNSNTSGATRITQYGLDALKALTDYMKRHQLVGARALDRFYARFGKKLEDAKLDRSMYIGSQNIPLQIGDVMSHSDTTGAELGAYAGKGIGYGADGIFEFSTNEYGLVVIISSVIPQIGYYQGVNRNVMHVGRLDYWTPEFDQIGNQAISKKEVFLPMNSKAEAGANASDFNNDDSMTGIFGYTPRYSEYKIGRDMLTGDYRLASLNAAGDVSKAWHLMRNIGEYAQTSASVKHSRGFVQGYDYDQYNRIFNNTQNTADKFYMIHTFNVVSQSPMHSLYDTYKFENEDEGAHKVVADVNGVKVN